MNMPLAVFEKNAEHRWKDYIVSSTCLESKITRNYMLWSQQRYIT